MEFPKDINNIIVKKLDIDTRRSLGIFVKLNYPEQYKTQLSKCLNKIQKGSDHVYIQLGPIKKIILSDDSSIDDTTYSLYRFFEKENEKENMTENRVHHFPTLNDERRQFNALFISFFDH